MFVVIYFVLDFMILVCVFLMSGICVFVWQDSLDFLKNFNILGSFLLLEKGYLGGVVFIGEVKNIFDVGLMLGLMYLGSLDVGFDSGNVYL